MDQNPLSYLSQEIEVGKCPECRAAAYLNAGSINRGLYLVMCHEEDSNCEWGIWVTPLEAEAMMMAVAPTTH